MWHAPEPHLSVRCSRCQNVHHHPPVLGRSVCELMAGPMVLTHWDEDVFVDVERRSQALSKHVHDVIVAICAVVEFDANRVLPFLRFENIIRVRSVKNEALKIEFPHTTQFWPRL